MAPVLRCFFQRAPRAAWRTHPRSCRASYEVLRQLVIDPKHATEEAVMFHTTSEKKRKKSHANLRAEAVAALKRLETKDPGIKQFLKKAYAYAVFPSVG